MAAGVPPTQIAPLEQGVGMPISDEGTVVQGSRLLGYGALACFKHAVFAGVDVRKDHKPKDDHPRGK